MPRTRLLKGTISLEYRSLGRTGAQVAVWCLGTMSFGWKTEQDEATRIVAEYLEKGGNFIDTANVYGRGKSETILGIALKELGARDKIVLATKVHGKMDDTNPNAWGNTRFNIIKAAEDSLRRLQTDHIDLYQIHRPQSAVPIDETLGALDDLVRSGKVRYIGTSTYAAWQVVESLWASKELGLNRFVTEQPPYHILDRRIERELLPALKTYGYGVIPWSPLAGGKLTGKYKRGASRPENSREDSDKFTPETWDVLEALEKHVSEKGVTLTSFANAWVAAQPGITSPIIGPNSVKQLQDNLAASEVVITDDDKKAIDMLVPPGTNVKGNDYYQADFGATARWH
jgi:aryl-alcohol dehydrogenase-like predicted oxidoreductase